LEARDTRKLIYCRESIARFTDGVFVLYTKGYTEQMKIIISEPMHLSISTDL